MGTLVNLEHGLLKSWGATDGGAHLFLYVVCQFLDFGDFVELIWGERIGVGGGDFSVEFIDQADEFVGVGDHGFLAVGVECAEEPFVVGVGAIRGVILIAVYALTKGLGKHGVLLAGAALRCGAGLNQQTTGCQDAECRACGLRDAPKGRSVRKLKGRHLRHHFIRKTRFDLGSWEYFSLLPL
jgi:hypothetical protein